MMCDAYCCFSSSFVGTITSASTVQSGRLSFFAAVRRQDSGSRIGFSSPTTSAGLTCSQNFSRLWFGKSPQHKPDVAFLEAGRDVRNALGEKTVVAKVGVRIEGHRREEYDCGLSQRVRCLNCHVQRGIIQSSLRPLHPVNDASASRIGWSGTPHGHPRIVSELSESIHDCSTAWCERSTLWIDSHIQR